MSELRDLKDSVVMVTGASSGIGAAATRLLAARGARTVLAARRAEGLDELVEALDPQRCLAVPTDVGSSQANRELVSAALERFGRLDSLVCAAGVGAYGGILDYGDEELQCMVNTHFSGTIWGIRAALPAMIQAGGGDIVVIASVAGLRGGGNEAVYAATKAAQLGLAGAVDRELRHHGIRVTSICPAATATEFAMGRGRVPGMPELATWMQADDVAEAVCFVLEQPRRFRTTQWHLWSAAEGA
jgi:3-oxoacyl-[acyl-carrier protein] reductase